MPKSNEKLLSQIGQRIDQEMEKNGITNTELAQRLGISRQAVDNYRNGISEPPIEKALKMADYFGVTLDWLFCREGAVRTVDADIASACKLTGLSKLSVEQLVAISGTNFASGQMNICNALIENSEFGYLLALMDAYVFFADDPIMPGNNRLNIGNVSLKITRRSVIKSEISSLVIDILEDIKMGLKKNLCLGERESIIAKRNFGKLLLGYYNEGKLTMQELDDAVRDLQELDIDQLNKVMSKTHRKEDE